MHISGKIKLIMGLSIHIYVCFIHFSVSFSLIHPVDGHIWKRSHSSNKNLVLFKLEW